MKQAKNDIKSFLNKFENSDDRWGWAVLFLYIAAISIISVFHEPWFDEAQAWIIARDVSFFDIIFSIPHYEGHPPLWHLYLALFAKSGIPYELGLKSAAIIINSIAAALIIFKSPFKKIIRYLIPFTYYFFYIYGVVSRCYSFTLLGFVLLAVTYRDRNAKPLLYVLSMLVLCLSMAYGLLFSAGIALIWLIEIMKDKELKSFFPSLIKDKRIYALVLLFISALAIVYIIMPTENTFAANLSDYESPFIIRLVYMLLIAPVDAAFFTSIPGNYTLMYCEITPSIIIIGSFVFAVFAFAVYIIGKTHGTLPILIIPYILFAAFAGLMYFTEHHLSIIAYFFLFWFWISIGSDKKYPLPESITKKIRANDIIKLRKLAWIFPAVLIGFPLYWNISACAMEIGTPYCSAREIAEFISENGFEDRLIMAEWLSENSLGNSDQVNIDYQWTPAYLAYFDKNIVYNFNRGDEGLCYNTHIIPTDEEVLAEYDRLRSIGAPDILIGFPDLYSIFGDTVSFNDYTLVKVIIEKRITKDDHFRLGNMLKIYVKNDLAQEYELPSEDEDYWTEVLIGNIKHK
ncbi:MAG: hypothetical protein JXN65_10880 [Clostridia bacterium]|nr:hypothetical protein [Clostridia bacterium]